LAFIGMQNIQLVVADPFSLVRLGDLSQWTIWLALCGLAVISVLTYYEVRGGILMGLVGMALIQWGVDNSWPTHAVTLPVLKHSFVDIDFPSLKTHLLKSTEAVLAFLFILIFNVSGVLYGLSKVGGFLQEDGTVPGGMWAFMASAVGTTVASLLGCSPLVIHVECVAGIKDGGRTGLTAVVTAAWFAISLFFAPIFEAVPEVASAPILILVGAMMMAGADNIDWDDMRQALPAFFIVTVMPFTFSIPNGIAFGLAAYFILFVMTGGFLAYRPFNRIRSLFAGSREGEEEEQLIVDDKTSDQEADISIHAGPFVENQTSIQVS